MEAIVNDLVTINREFFRLALNADWSCRVLRVLGASEAVANKIRNSTEEGRATAIKCRMPLVVLSDAAEELFTRHPHDWPPDRRMIDLPDELRSLTRFVLEVVWGMSRLDLTTPQMQFGLSRHAVEDLSRYGVRDLYALAERSTALLKLRAPLQPLIWDRLMIGARCEGPRATRISQQTAMMTVGLEA